LQFPKASLADHAADNAGVGQLILSPDDIVALDNVFARGPKPRHLPMI